MGLIRNMLNDVANRRAVRVQARKCREAGMTQDMLGVALGTVLEIAIFTAGDEPTEQYLKSKASSIFGERLPGLDPSTILLLVQLAIMIYQALKAVGFLDADGLSAVSPATINEHFGGL